jgi:hypothetical protein
VAIWYETLPHPETFLPEHQARPCKYCKTVLWYDYEGTRYCHDIVTHIKKECPATRRASCMTGKTRKEGSTFSEESER